MKKGTEILSTLREERMAAVQYGYNAKSHFNITDIIRSQLDFARKGLNDLGINVGFLNILDKRLENRISPGEYEARRGVKNLMDWLVKLSTKLSLIFGRRLWKISLLLDSINQPLNLSYSLFK